MLFTQFALVAGLAINAVNAISPISVKGSKFFTDDGNQFFLKGTISRSLNSLYNS